MDARSIVLNLIIPVVKTLAAAKHGTRVVQKAIEVADAARREAIIGQLKGSVVDMYKSPHANHVLSKLIEVLPNDLVDFVLAEIEDEGAVVAAAKHQYGCRVIERLIEHCRDDQASGLVGKLLDEAEALCCHQYGNFVMQHIFEHGSEEAKAIAIQKMVKSGGGISKLSTHRLASHVVQKALEVGGDEVQNIIVSTMTSDDAQREQPKSLVAVACERYGSFVVEEFSRMPDYTDKVREILKLGLDELKANQWGQRVAQKFYLDAESHM